MGKFFSFVLEIVGLGWQFMVDSLWAEHDLVEEIEKGIKESKEKRWLRKKCKLETKLKFFWLKTNFIKTPSVVSGRSLT